MTKPNLSSNMSKSLSVSHSGISDSPLLKRCGLSHIHSNHIVPREEEFQDGRSSFQSSPQTTSSQLDATYENSSNDSLDPVAFKIPCIPQGGNHLRVDYVPEDMVSGIGGLDLGRYSPRDMYKPIIRSYPYPYSRATRGSNGLDYSGLSPFIEHIDIATVWKGISLKDAQTLFRIHEAFKASLELLVIDALQKLSEEFRGECRYYRPDLSSDLSELKVTRKLKFSQSQLSDTMHRMSSPWANQLIGRTDLDFVMLLPLYLRTCDYLMKTNGERHQDTAIEVCARYEQPIFRTIPPRIVAEAAWIPDTLSFKEVRETYREGHELVIIPHYCSNSVFRPEVSHRNIRYSLGSSQSWLEWDESISGFRGNVPLYSELRGSTDTRFGKAYEYHDDRPYATASTIFIEIKALLAERFPPRFRLERTVRARLSFKVLPWYNTYASSDDYVKPSVWQYEGDFSPTVSSRKTSLSNVSLGIKSLHDEWDAWNQDWERSSSNDERQFNESGHLQFPEAKSRQEFHNGQTISSSELASPTERYQAIDDESTLSALSTLRNDETVDLGHENKNEAFMMDHNSQEDGSLDFFGSPSEPPQILCFSRFSSLHGLSDGSNDEGTNRSTESPQLLCFNRFSPSPGFQPDSSKDEETKGKTSPVETKLDGSLLSRSQSSQDVCKEYNDHSSMMTDSIDEIHLKDQALPFSDICTKDLEIQDSQATLMNVGSAFTEAMAQTGSLWPRQPSPSFPDTVKIKIPNSSIKTPPNFRMAVDQSTSESNRSCSDSSSLELIVENPDVDPRIRREQAILWRFLSRKESMARLSTAEQRNIYDAMKESAEEEVRRKNALIDEVDVLDDIFLADGSNVDDGEDALSSLGKSEVSSKLDSGLGSVDTELETSVNYGFQDLRN